jgi:molecular chaperone GrpE
MMIKKKTKDLEETRHEDLNKTSENKETTFNTGNSTGEESVVYPPDESTKSGTDNVTESGMSADKITSAERILEEKLAEMQDKYIRLSAEFDNYRKRTLREKMELSKYAGEDLLLKIIPLMDDFDRALKHMDAANDCADMKNGIDLIYIKFSEFLKQNGIKEIESLNNDFNVDLHEAIARIPVSEDELKGKVVDVVQKGYYLQDKVLRFSKVVVGE